jgi:hypothetical protein
MTYNLYMPVTDHMEAGGGDALFGGERGQAAAQVFTHVDRIPRRRVVEGVVHILNLHIRHVPKLNSVGSGVKTARLRTTPRGLMYIYCRVCKHEV